MRVTNDAGSIIAGGVFLASALGAPAAADGFGGLSIYVTAGAASAAYLAWTAVASQRGRP
ncbi:hypothetical protein ABI214_24045 [Prescottella soli]|uniref:Uncharacterized protein n=1 Tax=Prescottella soli TaxID=1543852 RepID=A0ABW9FTM4_9NOCA